MNNEFTKELGAWLEKPETERDYRKGAELLYQLTGNPIMFKNLSAAPERRKEFINYQLQKYYNVRVQKFTHDEVVALKADAANINKRYKLTEENPDKGFKSGKRGDHETLPDEIKQLYVDNLTILQRMRDTQTRLRILSEKKDGTVCPDSDLWPYLKELRELDIKYRDNWHRYDTYDAATGESTMKLDAREESKKYQRLVNLNKGKYRKAPNETLAAQIRDWYDKIINPTAKLTAELQGLGIL